MLREDSSIDDIELVVEGRSNDFDSHTSDLMLHGTTSAGVIHEGITAGSKSGDAVAEGVAGEESNVPTHSENNNSTTYKQNSNTSSHVAGHSKMKQLHHRFVRLLDDHYSLFNVIVLGVSFCVFFTSFNTTEAFLTELKHEAGFYALGILYLFFSCFVLLSSAVIDLFGLKYPLFVCSLTYSLFVLCGSPWMPNWVLMVTSALCGVGAAVLWTAHGALMVKISGDRLGFYTGLFFAIYQVNLLVGYLLAGVLFSSGVKESIIFLILLIISIVGNLLLLLLRTNKSQPSSMEEQTNIGSPSIGTDIEDAVDQVDGRVKEVKTKKSLREVAISIGSSIKRTIFVFKDKRMLLFIPIALHSGHTMTIIYGIIPPIIGKRSRSLIGYCMSFLGVSEIVGSILFGKLIDVVGKRAIMITTFALHIIATNSIWHISRAQPYMFFVATFLCGLADSAYNTSIYTILGAPTYFQDQASDAFAAFKLVQSLMVGIGFVASSSIPNNVIFIVLSVLLGLAISSWLVLDFFVAPADIRATEVVVAEDNTNTEQI